MINKSESKGIFVFAQQMDNHIATVAYELVSEARKLSEGLAFKEVTAVLLGHKVENLADRLAEYGADNVIVIDDPALEVYKTEPYVAALTQVIEAKKPDIMLFGASAIGRDLAPRVSARVTTGLVADCTRLDIQDPKKPIPDNPPNPNFKPNPADKYADQVLLRMTRPAFGGNVMATIRCPDNRPQIATVRPGVMKLAEKKSGAKAKVEKMTVAGLQAKADAIKIVETIMKKSERMDISDATILVSGGRGMGGPENYKILEELAACFPKATISASRAAVDAGWQPKDRQVGQTGKTVRPNVYFACGISGAIQHLAGMEESEVIIAINKNPDAPIFQVADFGVVGDLFKVVPALTKEIKKIMEAKSA
ncbi:MAG: electron transfer flavoprotein subunit alpha/FixB family protein [Treponemataceae bacterium]|nr:MAG: electron transfer flavoprotein subunit alpha/FixB family protein [Treponemataceae bacterium]